MRKPNDKRTTGRQVYLTPHEDTILDHLVAMRYGNDKSDVVRRALRQVWSAIAIETEEDEESVMIKLDPGLPCGVIDCSNVATVGTAYKSGNTWTLGTMCKSCTQATLAAYGIEVQE